MSAVTGQISWVYTKKLAPCVSFYRDALGLDVVRDAGTAMIFATGDGARIGVCEVFADRVVEPKGGMITLLVDGEASVDTWFARLEAAGVVAQGPPEKMERFGIYSFFVQDPNGYLIEVQCFL
ncbi:catechol 2,3-dioxygenase-like lactoylglutathione lyase family enzyme [Shimia isoporae]|uniref:Catechol 2,3-dioxygenase-like lactoylglutathione lyase family enzyme n=1 Tax=Shimia isoporae TaxID=647720 RepID=A0A4R1N4R5_9RHOB|nr:VOC family protein [Shimia isoporae]TCL01595.1 catechol 2,3-dioxygenase-like lactoylglutathione lyase family enzyme [Shimia isoporae]